MKGREDPDRCTGRPDTRRAPLAPSTLVRDVAVHLPGGKAVLESLHIDYCCDGGLQLDAACTAAHVSVQDLLVRLASTSMHAERFDDDVRFMEMPIDVLIDYIIDVHHAYTRGALGATERLAANAIAHEHQGGPPVGELAVLVDDLSEELDAHMAREELILFPYLKKRDAALRGGRALVAAPFGHLRDPLRVLRAEHTEMEGTLHEMRALTCGYATPPDACRSVAILYQKLAELDRDLVQHVHLENNVLFPRSLECFT